MKILIIGLPNSGKTTLAKVLSRSLPNCLHINADVVRATLNRDLGFSLQDRIENARRLNAVADLIDSNGRTVVTDFVCPTAATRAEFRADFTIWMDTIKEGRYEDTNRIYEPPAEYDWRVEAGATYDLDYIDQLVARILATAEPRCIARRTKAIPQFGEVMEHHKSLKGNHASHRQHG